MSRISRDMEGDPSPRHLKRPRVLVACQRCKTRRQKCDNASPACSNCSRAHVACAYSENAYPSSYVKMLEDRVGTLEARLSAFDPSQANDHLMDLETQQSVLSELSRPAPRRDTLTRPSSGQFASGLGLLSSCAAAEPHYFGFSSGLSLAHFVQAAIDAGASTATEVSLPSLADRPFSSQAPTSRTPLAPLPSRAVGSRFIKTYLSIIHPLYPFLDRKRLWSIHQNATRKEQPVTADVQLDLAVLHLVYAIGSRCLQLLNSSKVGKDISEGHFVSAMKHIPEAMRYTSIRSIEITLLLALHSMRSPSGTSVWHLCGLAMRECLELGLHKRRAIEDERIPVNETRKRLFWSIYIFERKTALVVGRPFAVSDKEIDTEIPLNVNDDEEDISSLSAAKEEQFTRSGVPNRRSTLSLHRHHILLYHIHTRIRFTLHRLKKADSAGAFEEKIAKRFQELEQWKENVLREYLGDVYVTSQKSDNSDSSSDSDSDRTTRFKRSVETEKKELLLEYHKARRSLLQPLMTEAQDHYRFGPSDYSACAESSGQICQLYRRLHRMSSVPFTLRDLHAVFVAGFTLIYCICAKPSLYDAQRAGDIGACSTVLYVITEQWPSAKTYRDAFETVVEKMVESTRKTREKDFEVRRPQVESETTRESATQVSQLHRSQRAPRSQPNAVRGAEQGARGSHYSLYSVEGGSQTRIPGDSAAHVQRPSGMEYVDQSNFQNDRLSTQVPTPAIEKGNSVDTFPPIQDFDTSIALDLDFDFDEIGGLLTNEGMDWFTGAVLWN